jgi:hypothetical protein
MSCTIPPNPSLASVDDAGFNISRVIRYKNSFLPVVKARFLDEMGHAEIKITMRPTPFVLAFMGIWTGGVSLGCIAAVSNLLDKSRAAPFAPVELVPFAMLLFGYGLCTIAFRAESSRAKAFLAGLWT